ncbi:hypothetical protein Plhal304r1_c012g0045011 [Plasmopara halstedii]
MLCTGTVIRGNPIKQTNCVIEKLDWKEVKAALFSTDRDDATPVFVVCELSQEEWERYV